MKFRIFASLLLTVGFVFSQNNKKQKSIEVGDKTYSVEYDMSYIDDDAASFNFTVKNEEENLDTHFEDHGKVYKVVYFHKNGTIAQKGFMTKDNKLHGTWKSFDTNGKKTSIGHYENGKKVGKWLFWTEHRLTEIDYIDHQVASVHEWRKKTQVAVK